MQTIQELVDIISQNNSEKEVKAILPDGRIIDVGAQYYVECDKYHMFRTQYDEDSAATISLFRKNLEHEASDTCWQKPWDIFDNQYNTFVNCEIYVTDCDCEDFDEISDEKIYEVYGFTTEENIVYMHCEPNFENRTNTSYINQLTEEERCLIVEALDHFGNHMAKQFGCSGEKYWDLMEKFK